MGVCKIKGHFMWTKCNRIPCKRARKQQPQFMEPPKSTSFTATWDRHGILYRDCIKIITNVLCIYILGMVIHIKFSNFAVGTASLQDEVQSPLGHGRAPVCVCSDSGAPDSGLLFLAVDFGLLILGSLFWDTISAPRFWDPDPDYGPSPAFGA